MKMVLQHDTVCFHMLGGLKVTFYTYQYLNQSQSFWQYGRIAAITLLVLIFMWFMLHYLRNKMDIKYKDLSIMIGTLLLLILGMQYNDYSNIRSSTKQTGQITAIVTQAAKELHVAKTSVSVNSTTQADGMLVKTSRGYYRVNFNPAGTAFVLEKVTLLDTATIKVEGD